MLFTAIDVETANEDLASICQIGIATAQDGAVVDVWKTLINPLSPFSRRHDAIHGIDGSMVAGAPSFREIIDELEGDYALPRRLPSVIQPSIASLSRDPVISVSSRWHGSTVPGLRVELGRRGTPKRATGWLLSPVISEYRSDTTTPEKMRGWQRRLCFAPPKRCASVSKIGSSNLVNTSAIRYQKSMTRSDETATKKAPCSARCSFLRAVCKWFVVKLPILLLRLAAPCKVR
jgi:hypothetical protein